MRTPPQSRKIIFTFCTAKEGAAIVQRLNLAVAVVWVYILENNFLTTKFSQFFHIILDVIFKVVFYFSFFIFNI